MSTEIKQYFNYAPILSATDSFSDEKLDTIIAEYKEQRERWLKNLQHSQDKYQFFNKNVNSLNWVKENRRKAKLNNEFTLTDNHIELIKLCEFIDNGNVILTNYPNYKEVAKALKITNYDIENDCFFKSDIDAMDKIIEELPLAINELFKTKLCQQNNK
jgi:hypothetical protein